MRFAKLVVISCALGLLGSRAVLAAECPAESGSNHLTLPQVMHHWGVASRTAGTLAGDGLRDPHSVGADEFQAARDTMETALECARIVATTDDLLLLPHKAGELTGSDRTEYIARFRVKVHEFEAVLNELHESLSQALLGQIPSDFFATMRARVETLVDIANAAHGGI